MLFNFEIQSNGDKSVSDENYLKNFAADGFPRFLHASICQL